MVRRREITALSRGRAVSKLGFSVFREHPKLLVFPLVSLVGSALSVAGLYASGSELLLWFVSDVIEFAFVSFGLDAVAAVLAYATFGFFVAVWTLVVGAANAALVRCTAQHVEGAPVRLRDGVEAAWRAKWTLLAFALLNGLVGVAVVALERSSDGVGDLVASLLGVAYGAVTVFVLPAAVLDGTGPVASFRRSVTLLTREFGDVAFVSLGVLQYVVSLFAIPFLLTQVLFISDMVFGTAFVDVLFEYTLWWGVPMAVSLAVGFVLGFNVAAVVKTALYLDLAGADPVPMVEAERDELASAFRSRSESASE
jgi:hypothetical protein